MIKYYLKLFAYYVFKTRYPMAWGTRSGRTKHAGERRRDTKVVFMCDGYRGHGGLTDRMRGLLTTYLEAKKHELPFFIYWTKPFRLEDFLVPAGDCDWRTDSENIGYNYVDSFPVIIDVSPAGWKNIFKKYIFKHSFAGKRDKLVYTNMIYETERFPSLYRELFKPSEYLQSGIDLHLKNIGSRFWSYTFRFGNLFGDFRDMIGVPLEGDEKQKLLEKNIGELKRLICELPDGFKAVVTSDSLYFLTQAEKLDNRIYVVKEKLLHVDFYKEDEAKKEIWLKSFLDQNLVMRAEKAYLLRTDDMYKSGFTEFAALIGGGEYVYHEF